MPGKNPARNRSATDTCTMTAYTTMITDGGMIGPMIADAALTAAENAGSNPSLRHGLDLDHAQAGGVGLRHTAHAGEDHACQHVDVREAAADVPDQRGGEIEDAIGNTGAIEQMTGQHEQRDRDQHETIEPGAHALHDDRQRESAA